MGLSCTLYRVPLSHLASYKEKDILGLHSFPYCFIGKNWQGILRILGKGKLNVKPFIFLFSPPNIICDNPDTPLHSTYRSYLMPKEMEELLQRLSVLEEKEFFKRFSVFLLPETNQDDQTWEKEYGEALWNLLGGIKEFLQEAIREDEFIVPRIG